MARRTYADGDGSPEERLARRLARYIIDSRPDSFTARGIYKKKIARIQSAPDAKSAIAVLVEAGVLRAVDVTGGRPEKRYLPNPRLWDEVQS